MRKSPLIALAILLVTLAWVGSGYLSGSDAASSADAPAARADASPVEVRVRESEAQDRVRTLVVLGRTRANRVVDIRAETDGRVDALSARKGTRVTVGMPLVHLDPADRRASLEEAEALLAQRQLQYDAAEKLQRRDFTSRVALAEALTNLGTAKALVAARELDLARTDIVAPFDGVLSDNAVEVGDYVKSGDVVATVVELSPLLVRGHVTEGEVIGLSPGREGGAVLADGKEVAGHLSYVASVADPATRTFPVDLEIPNPDSRLPEGITGELRLPLDSVRAHLVSPAVLALDDDGQVGVKYVDAEDRVAFAPVRVAGDGTEGFWVSGLPDRLSIITIGQAFVSIGQKVKPVHAKDIAAETQAQKKAMEANGAEASEAGGQ